MKNIKGINSVVHVDDVSIMIRDVEASEEEIRQVFGGDNNLKNFYKRAKDIGCISNNTLITFYYEPSFDKIGAKVPARLGFPVAYDIYNYTEYLYAPEKEKQNAITKIYDGDVISKNGISYIVHKHKNGEYSIDNSKSDSSKVRNYCRGTRDEITKILEGGEYEGNLRDECDRDDYFEL